jgi:hypothetical protein
MRAGTTWKAARYSIIEGEALALLETMVAMENDRTTHIIFETDFMCVIDAISNLNNGMI